MKKNEITTIIFFTLYFTSVLVSCLPNILETGLGKFEPSALKKEKKLKKAARYLATFGYLTKDDFDFDDPKESEMEKDLKKFQYFAHVPITGKLDAATIGMMEKPRCGMRDPQVEIKINKRSKRWTLQGNQWTFENNPERLLTWKLTNTGRNLRFQTVRRVISIALGKWSNYANINFRETVSDDADIIVKFVRLQHDDLYPFDGRGGTLAHAFYPYKGHKISGDIHFDNDEDFTYKKSYGTDILWVATHEAGHSLGLEHSQVQDAIMYPWYQGTRDKNFDLRRDDIIGIQQLYGTRPKTTKAATTAKPSTKKPTTKKPTTKKPTTKKPTKKKPTTKKPTTEKPTTKKPTTEKPTTKKPTTEKPTTKKPTTEKPTTKKPTTKKPTTKKPTTEKPTKPTTRPSKKPRKYKIDCPQKVDALVVDRTTGWMFAFNGKDFYLVSRRGVKHGPIKTKDYFKAIRKPVTAAYLRKQDGHLIIFTGNTYYEYVNFYMVKGPRPVTDYGLPADANVDASFYWKGNGRLYLFVGSQYYRYNERLNKMDRYYPRTISKAWIGLPSRITAAVTGFQKSGKPGPTYFISNDKFYEFNDKKIRIHDGYPKHIKSWLLCNSDEKHPQLSPPAGSLERYEVPIEP